MIQRTIYTVRPVRPYSLGRTLARLERFPERVDRFEDGTYRRLLFLRGRPLFLRVEQEGSPTRAELVIEIRGEGARTGEARRLANEVLERVLGATTDVRAFYRMFRADPLLGPMIRTHLGLRIAGRLTLWETLLQIVLSQQIHLKLAHGMLADLAVGLGRRARLDGETYYSFPTPRALLSAGRESLRRFRLSRAKAETLLGLAAVLKSGALSDEKLAPLPDDEAVELLTAHKGVGRWTAEFALLRGLGRVNVFPGGDLGVVKYFAREMLGYESSAREAEMRLFAERWQPYRGLALTYAYAELAARSERNKR